MSQTRARILEFITSDYTFVNTTQWRLDGIVRVGTGNTTTVETDADVQALRDADLEALEAVPDVGPVVAAHVRAFFDEPHNLEVLDALAAAGVRYELGVQAGADDRRIAEAYAAGIAVGGAVNVGRNGLDCN